MFNMDMAKMNNVQVESLRELKKGKRRSLMLQIARHIISAKGLRELKVRDVAEAADCSIGSVYNEFGDFDGLILKTTVSRLECLGCYGDCDKIDNCMSLFEIDELIKLTASQLSRAAT